MERIREFCIDMPEELYILVEYMCKSSVGEFNKTNDLLNCLILALNDIRFCRCSFEERHLQVPIELVNNEKVILNNLELFPLLVDAVSNESYSNRFRNLFEKYLVKPAPKRSVIIEFPNNIDFENEYLEGELVSVNY